MTATALPGPLSVGGLNPPQQGPTPFVGGAPAIGIPDNPDWGPSLFWAGCGVRDPRYLQRIGAGANVAGGYPNQDVGWYGMSPTIGIDQVPAALSATNIAANQHVVSGAAMALAGASAGITVLAAALTILPTGLVVPANSIVIDSNPAWQGAGQTGAFAFFDPAHGVARAVTITGAAGSAGGNFIVRGYDVYGSPMSQLVTVPAAGAATTLKCFKFVASVTPQFTDPNNYSVGTADVYGFPLKVSLWPYVYIFWNGVLISSSTGFTAADATAPATTATGDTRGSYATQSASDGVKRLNIFINQSVANVVAPSTYAAAVTGLLGQAQV